MFPEHKANYLIDEKILEKTANGLPTTDLYQRSRQPKMNTDVMKTTLKEHKGTYACVIQSPPHEPAKQRVLLELDS